MFENSLSSGKHMIIDIHDIQNDELLNNMKGLTQVLQQICRKYHFEILNVITHSFSPQGCTLLFLLSESHISLHTFPERRHISFDIYTCRQYETNKEYNEICQWLIETLEASKDSKYHIMDRNFVSDIEEDLEIGIHRKIKF